MASVSANEWECSQCTLLNPMNAERCAVCGKEKPIKFTYKPKRSNEWECSRCTLYNPMNAERCAVCNAAKPKPSFLNSIKSTGSRLFEQASSLVPTGGTGASGLLSGISSYWPFGTAAPAPVPAPTPAPSPSPLPNPRDLQHFWPFEIPSSPYILNFHNGPITEDQLPRDFIEQADYRNKNLRMLLAAADGPNNVSRNPEYHMYCCLPDDTGVIIPTILEDNLRELIALNSNTYNSGRKRIICYYDHNNRNHINNLIELFGGKIELIDTLDSRLNFNEQNIANSFLRPGGIIIRQFLTDEEYTRQPIFMRDFYMTKRIFTSPEFQCYYGPHPLGKRRNPSANDDSVGMCKKAASTAGGKRRRNIRTKKRNLRLRKKSRSVKK